MKKDLANPSRRQAMKTLAALTASLMVSTAFASTVLAAAPDYYPADYSSVIEASKAEAAMLRDGVGAADAAVTAAQSATRAARARLDALDEQIAAQSALVSKHDLELSKLRGAADVAASRLAAARGEAFSACLDALKDGADRGFESTKDLVARIGRASRLGERSRGFHDAGAASCRLILRALADVTGRE